jgi:hypothetical protein
MLQHFFFVFGGYAWFCDIKDSKITAMQLRLLMQNNDKEV